jgi:hypothetical protein
MENEQMEFLTWLGDGMDMTISGHILKPKKVKKKDVTIQSD